MEVQFKGKHSYNISSIPVVLRFRGFSYFGYFHLNNG